MTALILAGGDGLRLRPLTCSKPKAMLTVCNIPLLEYSLRVLKRYSYTDCIISADRFSNIITEYSDGRNVRFSLSEAPAGTAAALSKAALDIDGNGSAVNRSFVTVLCSDVLFDFNLQAAIKHHEYNHGDITLIVKKTDSPSDYTVAIAEDGLITDISEDLPRESCASNLAVTGIMVVSSELARRISEYGEDIISDCVPRMLKDGVKVLAFTETGFWLDVNSPEDYIAASYSVLKGELSFADATANRVSATADISESASVSAECVIGDNVSIARGAKIHGGIILSGAYIGERATVNQAVIGEGARVLSSAGVYEGAVIGGGAVIGENAVIAQNVKIWNERQIEPCAFASNDIKYGFKKPLVIDDEGVTGETNGIITPQIASVLGSAMASLRGLSDESQKHEAKIGIGYNEAPASKALAFAVASGVMSSGGEAWLFGETSEPGLSFCVRACELSAGCYVDAGVTAKLKFISSDGLSLTRREEKIIEAGLNRSEYRRAGFAHFGGEKECSSVNELYKISLQKEIPERLKGIRAVVNTSGFGMSTLCNEILNGINDKNGEPVVFHISADGRKISAYTDETGYVFHEKLTLLCCLERFRRGEDVALPYDFPTVADRLAGRYGAVVLRYSGCASSRSEISDRAARELAVKMPFVYDAAALMLNVLAILSASGLTLKKALEELPEFATSNRFVAINGKSSDRVNSIEILRRMCGERQISGDGVVINDNRGRVLIRPVKTGKGVMMHVESYQAEIASELCDFYQDLISEQLGNSLLNSDNIGTQG
ncbi:MAG: sugar phosphate nucleotidyltransferase [Oscillospiraceae bacterium]|nr:sugar phosphate nucleotidyltransferase [Oscillospiraceae bacterium]